MSSSEGQDTWNNLLWPCRQSQAHKGQKWVSRPPRITSSRKPPCPPPALVFTLREPFRSVLQFPASLGWGFTGVCVCVCVCACACVIVFSSHLGETLRKAATSHTRLGGLAVVSKRPRLGLPALPLPQRLNCLVSALRASAFSL